MRLSLLALIKPAGLPSLVLLPWTYPPPWIQTNSELAEVGSTESTRASGTGGRNLDAWDSNQSSHIENGSAKLLATFLISVARIFIDLRSRPRDRVGRTRCKASPSSFRLQCRRFNIPSTGAFAFFPRSKMLFGVKTSKNKQSSDSMPA